MRSLRAVTLLFAAMGAGIGSLAAPGVAGAQSPGQDSVTGSVATGEGRAFVEFTFDVHSGPSGEDPTGTVSFDALLIDLGELPVSCLTVSGNRASMIALILSSSPSAPEGVLISVEDDQGTAGDGLSWTFLSTLPSECPVPSQVGRPLLTGDLVVTDAQPLTARRQARQECIFIRAAHGRPAFRAWYGTAVTGRHAMRRCIRERSDD